MKNAINKIGTFNVASGTVIVSDPCYSCSSLYEEVNVLKGSWLAYVAEHGLKIPQGELK